MRTQPRATPPGAAPAAARSRAERTVMLAAGAGGAGLVLLAAELPWARAVFTPLPPLPAATVSLAGHDVAPGAVPLGLAALACLAAILATRGLARRLCGGLLAVLGVLAAADAVASAGRGHVAAVAAQRSLASAGPPHLAMTAVPWWAVAAAGGLLLVAAGVLAIWRAQHWPGMSARYDRPGGPPLSAAAGPAAWDALDRGVDPTVPDR